MAAFFERVLQISLSGSVIVLAVLALRLVLKNAPKRAVCLLWMIAVLRLLVPFEIQSDWSMQPPPPEFAPPQVQQEDYFDSGTVQSPVPPEFLENAVEYPLVQPAVPEKVTLSDVLPWLWLLGVILLAVHGAVSFIRLKRRVRDAVILEEGVWLCPGLDSAFVLGFFRPQIYLPVLTREERELVLLHERCHIRRGDHWWKLLAYAAVSIHWFNPLAWVTYILMCRDMELACDQETVKSMDNAKRKAYSAALLNCAARRSGIAACPVAFGEISVKERIKMVLHYRKPGFWVTLIALIAAMAVGVFLLTSPRTDLQRCERALKQWQKMDAYHFRQNQSNAGEEALHDFSQTDYWSADGEHLMKFSYGEDLGHWQHWKDGKSYFHEFGSLDAEWEDTGWHKTESQENEVIPWVMRLDWDKLTIHHMESADDGKTVLLTVDFPTLGPGTMSFRFDESEELRSVSRTFTGVDDMVNTGTIELVEEERGSIEKDIQEFGVMPELVQLYRELERLQRMEYAHLIIDSVDESDYPGWDTARQEFIRCGENYYRNYNAKNSDGTMVTTYLKFGGVLYAREYSDEGLIPNRAWEKITDRGFDENALLDRDWSRYEVLDIQRKEDGSTVILLQGDLNETDQYTTYFGKTYEFHLDPEGTLTTHIYTGHYKKITDDYFAQGIFEGTHKAVTHILDTPKEELEKCILAVKNEAFDDMGDAQTVEQLYRELDALQAAECVHLVMDTEKDNAHGGWDNRHREFVKWGNNWYWDADMLSDYGTIENSYLWYGQKMYKWAHANADGAPQHPWQESEERYDVPELLTKDWRALPVLEIRQEDGYTVVRLDGEPTDTERMTYYSLTYDFYLDRDGRLTKRVADFHVREFVKEVGYVETRATGTMTFPDTPDSEIQTRITEVWNDVKNDIRTIDIPAELSQLYSELKALQNAENVHLVIDMELDSDYPGWETCRQEFIRADDRFYRNFDYRSPAGPFTTTYLRYGQAVYAREYSDAGVVANRDWEHIQDRGFGELALLNQDWTRFQVLDITKQADGSAVITMQGSLDPTDGVTYHEKIYEFHLDPNGRLTTQIVRANYTSEISDGFAQGTFEFEATDTVHILNTPCEELTKRILEVTMEVLDYRGKAQKSGN